MNFFKTPCVTLLLSCLVTLTANSQGLSEIQSIIDKVSIDSLVKTVRAFSGEDSTTVNGEKVLIDHRVSNWGNNLSADYLVEQLEKYDLVVNDNTYSAGGRNIYAVQEGLEYPEDIYIICGHYDAVDFYCADDNASASATILEAARILSEYDFENTIIYAFWDEEEIGLRGAAHFAQKAANDGDKILGVLNIDMMAYDNNNDKIFDIDVRNIANSYQIRDDLISIVEDYSLDLIPKIVDPGTSASDHSKFWSEGYSAVLFGESWETGDQNSAYHTENDRIDLFNIDYYHEMAKVAIGYMAYRGQLFTTATDYDIFETTKVNIYPNPTSNILHIDFEHYFEGCLRVLNTNGQVFQKQIINGLYLEIDLSAIETQILFIEITNQSDESKFFKVIKE